MLATYILAMVSLGGRPDSRHPSCHVADGNADPEQEWAADETGKGFNICR